jgi:hypothetical protein
MQRAREKEPVLDRKKKRWRVTLCKVVDEASAMVKKQRRSKPQNKKGEQRPKLSLRGMPDCVL